MLLEGNAYNSTPYIFVMSFQKASSFEIDKLINQILLKNNLKFKRKLI